MTDEVHEEPQEEQVQQIQIGPGGGPIITKQIVYTGLPCGVESGPDGSKRINFIDPVAGTVHVFPLDAEAAREIGKGLLSSGIQVAGAHEMPPSPQGQ